MKKKKDCKGTRPAILFLLLVGLLAFPITGQEAQVLPDQQVQVLPKWATLPVGERPVGIFALGEASEGYDLVVINSRPSTKLKEELRKEWQDKWVDEWIDEYEDEHGVEPKPEQISEPPEPPEAIFPAAATMSRYDKAIPGWGFARFKPQDKEPQLVHDNKELFSILVYTDENKTQVDYSKPRWLEGGSIKIQDPTAWARYGKHYLIADENSPYIFVDSGEVAHLDDIFKKSTTPTSRGLIKELLEFPTGIKSMATADFNNDGTDELALISGTENRLYVMQGDGDCNFLTPNIVAENEQREKEGVSGDLPLLLEDLYKTYKKSEEDENTISPLQEWDSLGEEPCFVTARDVNNDGFKDLVVTSNGEKQEVQEGKRIFFEDWKVYTLLGNGDGSFKDQKEVTAGIGLSHYAVIGDFNNDLNPDLIVANNEQFAFLKGNGDDGTFEKREVAEKENLVSYPRMIVSGDFNKDGNLDLAAANTESTIDGDTNEVKRTSGVDIWLGNGDGSFKKTQSLLRGRAPSALVAMDLDGDGDLDLAVTDQAENAVAILLNTGDAEQLFVCV
ncbi:VCBS repeat-containing protein [Candidatus Bipolaricaulota bacterium]|nr:VCBS repeat-containing protein [Candidatus Bipolaricaulota bacterium]